VTLPNPQRVITVTARNRRTGDLEHYRVRDPKMSREDAIALMGMWLNRLGWQRHEVMITHAKAETEDLVTQQIRSRMMGTNV
jgi:hypothetical protein